MNGMLRFALGMANMPQATIDDLEKQSPAMARIVQGFKELEPILTKAAPLFQEAEPIIAKMWPDIVAATPTAEELIEFAIKK